MDNSLFPISYIHSFLDLDMTLPSKKLLKGRKTIVQQGDVVKCKIDSIPLDKKKSLEKLTGQIFIALQTRQVNVPADSTLNKSKYNITID